MHKNAVKSKINVDQNSTILKYARNMHKYESSQTTVRPTSTAAVTVSVVGARGYSGIELIKLLLQHPLADLKYAFATSEFNLGTFVSQPKAKNVLCFKDSEIMNHLTEVVFLATPAEVSLELAPKLIAAGSRVIDLSGAFRLKKSDYQKWYKFDHHQPNLLAEAVYGLVPWVRAEVVHAKLIANPGCYATAINMALLPVLKNDLIEKNSIVIDAKSGATGAGKKAAENLIFCEVDGDCLPYKVGEHQHTPEIQEVAMAFAAASIDPFFTTSLLPVRRGISAGIYAQLKKGVTSLEIADCFEKAYAGQELISHGSLKTHPHLMQLRKVVGTARTHISYEVKGEKLYLFSCIDNLLKGAAGQAIENFNLILDRPSSLGLDHLEAQI